MHKLSMQAKLAMLSVLSIVLIITYQFIFVDMKFFDYAMYIRTPKLIAIIIAAFCIGYASMIFQTLSHNRIVTPSLLGMNSLYVLIHTSMVFFLGQTGSIVLSPNVTFIIDVILMGIMSVIIYGTLFKKTRNNVLYVLLAGSVLGTLFSSISNTMVRVMDPNEYDALLSELVAGFDHVNSDLLIMATILVVATMLIFYKEMKVLDVISLGRQQAINLGVDYDKSILKLLLGVAFLITTATALVGPLSFLGLITANLSRELFKTYKHSYLMLGSFLMGVVVLLGGQVLIEHLFGFSTQISVFVNLFGGAYFLYLILKNKGV
ncbi:iron chelate uptake ABC transporter family permease subunit [Candidatus Epulonipiscium viviparus]|uniref:iron chelate uptake ABC transporter family permease subunit n=1 Tax=Candidatus Epulonipiscium viviparus TaxID=420336 RepID=UPI0027381585|nr:iron chelate uptake ABC transporter family permease subunit [Candidatus Epulopiscium viviparus]